MNFIKTIITALYLTISSLAFSQVSNSEFSFDCDCKFLRVESVGSNTQSYNYKCGSNGFIQVAVTPVSMTADMIDSYFEVTKTDFKKLYNRSYSDYSVNGYKAIISKTSEAKGHSIHIAFITENKSYSSMIVGSTLSQRELLFKKFINSLTLKKP